MEPVILAALVGIAGGAVAASLAWGQVLRRSNTAVKQLNARLARAAEAYEGMRAERDKAENELAEAESALRLRASDLSRADRRIDLLTDELGRLQSIAYVRNAKGQMKRWTDPHG